MHTSTAKSHEGKTFQIYFRFQLGQRDALGEILGSVDLADDYIDVDKGEVYMARGHLAPRADFIYKSWQVNDL